MGNQTQFLTLGHVNTYSEQEFAEALNGAFVNAELKRRLAMCEEKAMKYDLMQEVRRMKEKAILNEHYGYLERMKAKREKSFFARLFGRKPARPHNKT